LSGEYPIDVLFYFLVLRGLLEQVLREKIVEKVVSSRGNQQYKIKMNPYDRYVYEDEVLEFLNIFYNDGISCSRTKHKPYQNLYDALIKKMFFDVEKKKNFIYYFDLIEHLVLEFMDIDTSSCDMSFSKTQLEPPSLSDLICDSDSKIGEDLERHLFSGIYGQ